MKNLRLRLVHFKCSWAPLRMLECSKWVLSHLKLVWKKPILWLVISQWVNFSFFKKYSTVFNRYNWKHFRPADKKSRSIRSNNTLLFNWIFPSRVYWPKKLLCNFYLSDTIDVCLSDSWKVGNDKSCEMKCKSISEYEYRSGLCLTYFPTLNHFSLLLPKRRKSQQKSRYGSGCWFNLSRLKWTYT